MEEFTVEELNQVYKANEQIFEDISNDFSNVTSSVNRSRMFVRFDGIKVFQTCLYIDRRGDAMFEFINEPHYGDFQLPASHEYSLKGGITSQRDIGIIKERLNECFSILGIEESIEIPPEQRDPLAPKDPDNDGKQASGEPEPNTGVANNLTAVSFTNELVPAYDTSFAQNIGGGVFTFTFTALQALVDGDVYVIQGATPQGTFEIEATAISNSLHINDNYELVLRPITNRNSLSAGIVITELSNGEATPENLRALYPSAPESLDPTAFSVSIKATE